MKVRAASTILIVDDQPDIVDTIAEILISSGNNYKCIQANNGHVAFDIAKRFRPDLIIMDWDMPCMNGYDALLKLKSDPITIQIPVVMSTGRTSPSDLDNALNAGAADYICKPIEKQELLARIRTCLNISFYIEEIKNKNDKLVNLNREKDGLINVVAHDLRSPLAMITSFVDLIQNDTDCSSGQIEHINLIKTIVSDSLVFIEDLLDVHAFEHNKLVKVVDVSIPVFLSDLSKKFEQDLLRKKQQLILKCDISENIIQTDPSLLGRLLNNLVSNASKFSAFGKIVTISVSEVNTFFQFSIQDQGPGISPEDQKNLFKQFHRLSAMPTGGERSNGLGLSIVKSIVEKLHGKISVQTELGKGANFIVKLPQKSPYLK